MHIRLGAILIIGAVAIVGTHHWQNKLLRDSAKALELSIRATKVSHADPDGAVLLIEQATALDPNNASIWYDASGIYGVKAMAAYVPKETGHIVWLEKSIDAARRADELSDDWFYTRDHADTLLFAYMYQYNGADLDFALALYKSIPDTGNKDVNRNIYVRVQAVERILADRKEFFNDPNDTGRSTADSDHRVL